MVRLAPLRGWTAEKNVGSSGRNRSHHAWMTSLYSANLSLSTASLALSICFSAASSSLSTLVRARASIRPLRKAAGSLATSRKPCQPAVSDWRSITATRVETRAWAGPAWGFDGKAKRFRCGGESLEGYAKCGRVEIGERGRLYFDQGLRSSSRVMGGAGRAEERP